MQLKKISIQLLCQEPGMIKGHAGTELHGLFFKALENADGELASELHQMQYKPFIIGPLIGKIQRRDGIAQIEEGNVYSFTLATLVEKLTVIVPDVLEYFQKTLLVIGSAGFTYLSAKEVTDKRTYYDFMAIRNQDSRINIEFTTPTCFRRSGRALLFPEPELVFGSLIEKWEYFSEIQLPILDLSQVNVTKYDLKTTLVQFNNYNMIGFSGKCTYTFAKDSTEVTKWAINSLAQFATLSGVGYKTTMGMGQVKIYTNNK
ncbi:CRISPR-associated endoribonuclease Cas6 [Desulfuribacillus alkaliarsenatis]|uniref:CRISPR-associated endoribonuclease Cas6 n=1 Tax=Desulfuribacillus alkaliarsenatis TaxID=766136 RepID=A0A1E5G2F4_9FIRM|nr:CRISPR-associated endoribonuclease Cas6 [Desulfuribacillus alkaliarsenatis]OEF97146.1 CRISPR-associated endoribonuclease Cas6 [Desulfuribacillus alkaliarsenatis]